MKKFTSVKDVNNIDELVSLAKKMKENPFDFQSVGKNKSLGLFFFNSSLRTRMSTQKAAQSLGMNVMIMNLNNDGWSIEMNDGTIMNQGTQEHIKEAARVISQYCDIIGVRTFAGLKDRTADYQEEVLTKFIQYASVPILSLESATLHPLQSLADLITITENTTVKKPKVLLTWAPHPKALPQAVANSFVEWMSNANVDLRIANPIGFDLAPEYTNGIPIFHNQNEAFKDVDFVYAKNWSSYTDYGKIGANCNDWIINQDKMQLSKQSKFMHCLPVRRNVIVTDDVLDSPKSLVIEQANNRTFAAQAVLYKLLENETT